MNPCQTLAFALEKTQESLTSLLADLPGQLATFSPDNGQWSVVNCLEHLILVERSIAKILLKPAGEPDAENLPSEKFGAARIKQIMGNRERKYPAPDFFAPKGNFSSLEEAKTVLAALRSDLVKALRSDCIQFSAETVPHPVMGDFTKLDWVNFLIEHAARHNQQIGEIKLKLIAQETTL